MASWHRAGGPFRNVPFGNTYPNLFPHSADNTTSEHDGGHGAHPRVFDQQMTEDAMDGINGMDTQQIFGFSSQNSALNTQSNMVNNLMGDKFPGSQQTAQSQSALGLRADALNARGIGSYLNIVT